MKCISIENAGKVIIKETEKPKSEKGHAILKLLYGGICGSDMGTYKGSFLYSSYPRIPGHEFSAQIEEIKENEYGLEKGMIVTANPYFNCGECYSCKRGFVNCCMSSKTMGVQRDGAFCEYISMPLFRIYNGEGLSAKKLALAEPFCISYHAVKRIRLQKGERVLVVGSGPIGYFAAAAAKLFGAEVYCCDIAPAKLEKVKELGVKTILNSSKEAFLEQVRVITEGEGFDVCIEAVGLPSTFHNCIDAAAHRGRISVVGISKKSFDFNSSEIQRKELDVFGSRNALREDFIEVIKLFQTGKVNPEAIISTEYYFEDAKKAFEETAADAGNKLKVMFRF